jgi:uncharacterized protein YdiU (UPF0061 family)
MGQKLGFTGSEEEDAGLVTAWLQHLQDNQLDYSLSFQHLAERIGGNESPRFGEFETRWLKRIDNQPGGREKAAGQMAGVNPVVIPRNHQVERAIRAAFEGDFTLFHELRKVLAEPFTLQEGLEHYSEPTGLHERVEVTCCGT